MTNSLTQGLSPQEQARQRNQLYLLMGSQAASYHKARHMGNNTSISSELARELLESMLYTLDQVGGLSANPDPALGLEKGQAILTKKIERAVQLFRLTEATAPSWQGECRWDTLQSLRKYLETYDLQHLAHRVPEILFYPLPVPDAVTGIDCALYLLEMLWLENRVMDAFPEALTEPFWNVFCQNDRGLSENQCQQLLVNAVGKYLLNNTASALVFCREERDALLSRLSSIFRKDLPGFLTAASHSLLNELGILDSQTGAYAAQTMDQLCPRLAGAIDNRDLSGIYL